MQTTTISSTQNPSPTAAQTSAPVTSTPVPTTKSSSTTTVTQTSNPTTTTEGATSQPAMTTQIGICSNQRNRNDCERTSCANGPCTYSPLSFSCRCPAASACTGADEATCASRTCTLRGFFGSVDGECAWRTDQGTAECVCLPLECGGSPIDEQCIVGAKYNAGCSAGATCTSSVIGCKCSRRRRKRASPEGECVCADEANEPPSIAPQSPVRFYPNFHIQNNLTLPKISQPILFCPLSALWSAVSLRLVPLHFVGGGSFCATTTSMNSTSTRRK